MEKEIETQEKRAGITEKETKKTFDMHYQDTNVKAVTNYKGYGLRPRDTLTKVKTC